jgi:hypothetical protein
MLHLFTHMGIALDTKAFEQSNGIFQLFGKGMPVIKTDSTHDAFRDFILHSRSPK